MLSLRTIEPHTLELLKALMQEPALCELRLVGGTAEEMKQFIINKVKTIKLWNHLCQQEWHNEQNNNFD